MVKDRAAILDVDGTLYPGALGVDLLGALVEANECDPRSSERVFVVLTEYRRGVIDFSTMALRAYEAYAAALAGREVARIEAIADEVWASKRSRVFAFVPELLAQLRGHGFVPMLISGSPIEMIARVARELDIEVAHGAVFGRVDGRYTGRIELSSGRVGEKLRIFSSSAAARFELSRSFAIGDSLTDAALFDRVALPLVFEPDTELGELAHARGWTIATRDDVLARARALLATLPAEREHPLTLRECVRSGVEMECSC